MCSIAGICDFTTDLRKEYKEIDKIISDMGVTMLTRGPDDFRTIVDENIAFSHTRLAVIDIEGGAQPMTKIGNGYEYKILAPEFYLSKCPLLIIDNFSRYTIVYNGELYNTEDLRNDLIKAGYSFETTSDTEVLLTMYIEYGEKCVEKLNGIFAFAIWDSKNKSVFFARDRFGVKPLFYYEMNGRWIFSSEIKGILKYPGFKACIDREGICEIFGIGPARSPGNGVYKGIYELKPGYAMKVTLEGCRSVRYYQVAVHEHEHNYEETVEHTWELLNDAITRQLVSDVPLCTLLSGGIDSSIISAAAAIFLKKKGEQLSTYSFDYNGNDVYFKANKFQPEMDEPYVNIMVNHIGSKHKYLYCDHIDLYSSLYDAVKAKDLPGMTDVDSSLLYFARKIKENHTVCLSGECADEVFGGYPWFRDEEWFDTSNPRMKAFPWTKELDVRLNILNKDILKKINLQEYVENAFDVAIKDTPYLQGESIRKRRCREISYLNLRHFMTTLLDRKDRMTMYSGLEVRVPFADDKLIDYIYNVPWDFKFHNGVVKGLLRDSAGFLLPKEVKYRRKSPYPKSYDPKYERLLKQEMTNIFSHSKEPINELIDNRYIQKMLLKESNLIKPWFGQLMAGPQIYAYLIQINYWLKEYNIDILI